MAKVYNCPECNEPFTTNKIKQNGKYCPGCGEPLRHDMTRSGGTMEHSWIVDDSREKPPVAREKAEAEYERISPGDNPEIFKLIAPNVNGDLFDFQIVYWDKFSQTHLRCPACETYISTTSTISGGEQETLCRASSKMESGKWGKCKTRTRFIFLRRGQSHEIAI